MTKYFLKFFLKFIHCILFSKKTNQNLKYPVLLLRSLYPLELGLQRYKLFFIVQIFFSTFF